MWESKSTWGKINNESETHHWKNQVLLVGSETESNHGLKIHITGKHVQEGETLQTCDVCEPQLLRLKELNRHKKEKHGWKRGYQELWFYFTWPTYGDCKKCDVTFIKFDLIWWSIFTHKS